MVGEIICLDAHVIIQAVPVTFIMGLCHKQHFPEPHKWNKCLNTSSTQNLHGQSTTPFCYAIGLTDIISLKTCPKMESCMSTARHLGWRRVTSQHGGDIHAWDI